MNKTSFVVILAVGILLSFGFVMVFNTSSAEVLDRLLEIDTHAAFFKQVLFAMLGFFLGLFVWKIGYKAIFRLSPWLMLFVSIMLILVFIPGIGQQLNGAKRWIRFGGFTIQPSEMAKFIIPFYFANRLSEVPIQSVNFKFLLKILFTIGVTLSLILFEPDNGTCIIIMSTLVMLFFLMRVKFIYWALPLLCLTTVGSIAGYNMPHVRSRIRVYLHPEEDILGKGHQPYQAKIAAGSGRGIGKGLGQSLQKLNYLPEARSDYIAAIFAEEFGFLGISFMIILYMIIAGGGFYIAVKAREIEGFYLATIITFLITFQGFLNLGVVSGLLPSKGVTLPFFSQGGTSLIVNIMAIFLLIQVAYEKEKSKATA